MNFNNQLYQNIKVLNQIFSIFFRIAHLVKKRTIIANIKGELVRHLPINMLDTELSLAYEQQVQHY